MTQGKVVQFPVPAPDEPPFVEPSGWESEPPPVDYVPIRLTSTAPRGHVPLVTFDRSGATPVGEESDRPRRSLLLVASVSIHALLLWLLIERGFDNADLPIDHRVTEIPVELIAAPPPLPEAAEVETATTAEIEEATELAPLVDDEEAKLDPPQDDQGRVESAADLFVPSEAEIASLSGDDLAELVNDKDDRREPPQDERAPETVDALSVVRSDVEEATLSHDDQAAGEPFPVGVEGAVKPWAAVAAEPYPTDLLGIDKVEQAKDTQIGAAATAVAAGTWAELASAQTTDGTQDAGASDFVQLSAVDADAAPTGNEAAAVAPVDDTAGVDARTLYGGLLRAHLVEHGALAADGIGSSLRPAIIIFTVDRVGRASRIRLIESSGSRQSDDKARKMIVEAAPFPPFPDNIKSNSLIVRMPVRLSPD